MRIPTEEDIQRGSLSSGRLAARGPSVSVGAGLAAAGQGLVQAAYSLSDLRAAESVDNLNKRSNDASMQLTRFLADEEQRFVEERDNSSESAIGFTRQFMESHQQRANDWARTHLEGLSDEAQTTYNSRLLARGNSLFVKANDFEARTKGAYYDRAAGEALDTYRSQIRVNAADFDTLKQQGIDHISSADMPEPWKAARIAAWESDAAEARWRWEFQSEPQRAVAALRPTGAKNLIRDEEGFRSEPYWDVNAWRIGYGSDTITLPDGSQQQVRPGMKITREDAERDLEYRLSEREGAQARRQLGDQWETLSAGAQAALSSVAYNYGSLPSSVVTAAKTGNMEALAQAVENLASNPERRRREAAIIRGAAQVDIEDEFADIPFERREQLAQWGASQYEQQLKDEAAERSRIAAQTRDSIRLGIATGDPNVTESSILENPALDDGDKATLINSLGEKRSETRLAGDAMARMDGGGRFDVFNSDDRKGVNLAYDAVADGASVIDDRAAQAAMGYMIERSGIIPKTALGQIRAGLLSADAQTMAVAATLSSQIASGNRSALQATENGAALIDAASTFDHLTGRLGLSAQEAGARMVDMRDPAKQREREALLGTDTVRERIKRIDANDVASVFGPGLFSRAPKLGESAMAEALIVEDYRAIYEESLVDAAGDFDLAEDLAAQRMSRIYGASDLTPQGGNVVVKHPPEVAYPAIDGSHDYIREQLEAALANEGVKAQEVFLQPYLDTEADIRAGRAPHYQVYYEDENGTMQMYHLPFFAEPELARAAAVERQQRDVEESERSMIESRDRIIERGATRRERRQTRPAPANIMGSVMESMRGSEEDDPEDMPEGAAGRRKRRGR